MSRIDDELTRRLRRASVPVVDHDVVDAVTHRRRWVGIRRRAGAAVLTVVVLAGVAVGYRTLDRAFAPLQAPSDGVIVFRRFLRGCPDLPHVGGGLDIFAVSPEGATQWRLNPEAMHSKTRSVFETDPVVSPDGTRFAFVDYYVGGLWVADVAGGAVAQLADGSVDSPVWTPDGSSIVFERRSPATPGDGTAEFTGGIYTVPSAGGEHTLLAEGASTPVFSPDGATIAYIETDVVEDVEGNAIGRPQQSLWFMDPDGSDQRQMAIQPEDREFSVRDGDWSPDGEHFVAEVATEGNVDLYVVNIDGQSGYRLTDDLADDVSPSWSPDGDWIAFGTGRWGTGVGHSEIAVVPAAGGQPTRLTNDCWDDFDPSWAPNDDTIRSLQPWTVPPLPDTGPVGPAEPGQMVFVTDVEGVSDVYAIDPEGGTPVNLTGDVAAQGNPVWSPDHERIAFAQYAGQGDADTGTVVMNRDGSDRRVVVPGGGRPTWSPDGTRLAIELPGSKIGVVDLTTGEVIAVTDGARDLWPAWSPDGTTIAFSRDGALVLLDVATGEVSLVVKGDVHVEPDWSPDGSWIAFRSGRDIVIVRPDGSGLRNLTQGPQDSDEQGPAWSPDGAHIAFTTDAAPSGMCVMDVESGEWERVEGSPDWVTSGMDW